MDLTWKEGLVVGQNMPPNYGSYKPIMFNVFHRSRGREKTPPQFLAVTTADRRMRLGKG